MILKMPRILFFIIFIFAFVIQNSYAEILKEVKVTGNKRISKETILIFGQIKINENLEAENLDDILKKLYETNFFSDVKLNFSQNILEIILEENPIIQNVVFNGIPAKKTIEKIKEVIQLKDKSSFIEYQAKQDLNAIKSSLQASGYFFAKVKSSIKNNSNDTIDLIYDIELGDKALIGKIQFIGDKKFKDRKLRNIIVSEESKFWKFISNKKYLDQSRINLDVRLLRNFYVNKGYYQVKVANTSAKFHDTNKFDLVFNINAGKKFYFNNLRLVLPKDYNKNNFKDITEILKSLKDQTYSYNKIQDILDEIDKIALSDQYEFINAEVEESIVGNNKLDFSIVIKETKKYYVERINVFGNSITQENVIRDALVVDEGDAFNEILHNKSINKLKYKNIFKTVNSEIVDGSTPNNKIINLTVEEKPTGEISAGAGYGTSGGSMMFAIRENNYLGRAIGLNANLTIGNNTVRGLFSVTNPNFKYSGNELRTTIQSTVVDKLEGYGFKTKKTGVSLGTSFEQYQDLHLIPTISSFVESVETNSDASANLKKQEGDYFDTLFTYNVSYDKRNQSYQPSDGFRSIFTQTLPLFADNQSLVNGYEFNYYHELIDEMIGNFTFYTRMIHSINDEDVRISKRLYIPSRRLRGFEPGKIGPKDGSEHVGGNYLTSINLSTTLPQILPNLQSTDFKLFFDVGNVWGIDYSDTIDDSNKFRTSTGITIDWFTPVGPLNFSLSQPLTTAGTDVTESFRFNLGTTF
tara:strand:+ start:4670 stop:6922 length:2253 start_codon:yes stop_codon:yes gene_type:complete